MYDSLSLYKVSLSIIKEEEFTVSEKTNVNTPMFKSKKNSTNVGFVLSGLTKSTINGSSLLISNSKLPFMSLIAELGNDINVLYSSVASCDNRFSSFRSSLPTDTIMIVELTLNV